MNNPYEVLEKTICALLIAFISILPLSIYVAQSAVHMAMILWLIKIFIIPLKERIWLKTPIDTPFFFLILVLCVAFIANLPGGILGHELRSLRSYRHVLILFVIVNNIRDRKVHTVLMMGSLISIALHGVWSGYLASRAHGLGSVTESILYWHAALFSLLLFFAAKDVLLRWFYAVVCVCALCGLVVHQKYDVWMAFCVSLVVSLIWNSRKAWVMHLAMGVLYLGVFYLSWMLVHPLKQDLMMDAVMLVRDRPLGTITNTKYLLQGLHYQDNIHHFHNDFLQTAVTAGVIAMVAFLWFFFSYISKTRQAFRKQEHDTDRAILCAGAAACCGLIALGFMDGAMELSKNQMCIFFFMGITLNLILSGSRLRDFDKIAQSYR